MELYYHINKQSKDYGGMIDFCKKIKEWSGTSVIEELRDILIQAENDTEYLKTITDAACHYCATIDTDDYNC